MDCLCHIISLLGFPLCFGILQVGYILCMWVIITELSICTSRFCMSTLSNLILVIYSSGFLVTSYSSHLANLLRSFFTWKPLWLTKLLLKVLSALVLRFCTYCIFFLLIKRSKNIPCLLVQVSDHCSMSCWVT